MPKENVGRQIQSDSASSFPGQLRAQPKGSKNDQGKPKSILASDLKELHEAAPKGVDVDAWDRCVQDVMDKSGNKYNAYAVCSASLLGTTQHKKKESTSKEKESDLKEVIEAAPKGVNSDDWSRCVHDVMDKSGDKYNAYAVCSASLLGTTNRKKKESNPELTTTTNPTDADQHNYDLGKKLAARYLKTTVDQLTGDQMVLATYLYKKLSGMECTPQEIDLAGQILDNNFLRESASKKDKNVSRHLEGNATKEGQRFKVILIKEGLGNFRDAFFYTRQALENAAPLFEGKKIYTDHPDSIEQETRPERSVKDIIGHFENVGLSVGKDGQSFLDAEVVIPDGDAFDWARGMMEHAITYHQQYPDKDFVGLSINAYGDADEVDLKKYIAENDLPQPVLSKLAEALKQGIETIRVTTQLTDAVSCDLVTEAGAGGKILKLLEGAKHMPKTKKNLKESEDEKKVIAQEDEAKHHEDESEDGDGKDDGDDGHDDAAADKKLIADMIKKHMGDDGDDDDDDDGDQKKEEGKKDDGDGDDDDDDGKDMAMAHEAYEAYREMGHKEEEAAKMAAAHVKAAKHMASKHAEEHKKESEHKQDEADPSKALGTQTEKKESSGTEVVKLAGRVSFLEAELRKRDLKDYVNTKVRESGLVGKAKDAFMTAAGKITSEKDLDSKLSVFLEGRNQSAKGDFDFILTHEAPSRSEDEKDKLSFADCLK